jgi:DHA1 family bicyclomycin/chloramphenicol resistance-like MFS transporter
VDKTMTRYAIVLGALSAAGPMAIDMYLPALPTIARELHATQGQVEMSMTTFFIGLTIGQPFYGPLSDRIGRKPPLVGGVMLYVLASLACGLATSASMLIAARCLQGVGAGAAIAISAAIIRDTYTGHQAARLLALRMLVLGLSPILSPIFGASLIQVVSWRYVFWFAAAYGLAGSCLLFLIPETRGLEHRANTKLSGVFKVYGRLLSHTSFTGAVASVACMQLAFSGYIAGSSFVFVKLNHTPPWLYGLIFATNAIGFITCAQFAPNLMRRFSAEKLIVAASTLQTITAVALFAAAYTHHATIPVLIGPLFLFLGTFGLVGGPATVVALRDHGPVAGTAASLLSFMQWGSAALGAGMVAAMANGTAMPMASVMLGGALLAFVVVLNAFGRRKTPDAGVAVPTA